MDKIEDFVCGLAAGWAQILTGQPLDYLKTQSQLSHHKMTLHHIRQQLKSVIATHGILGLYRGSSSLFFGFAFTIGTEFAGYEACKKYLMKNKYSGSSKSPEETLNMTEIFLSGGLVGFLVSFIFCPIQYVKIIRQTDKSVTKGSLTILMQSVIQGKVHQVYQGFLPTLFRETLGTAIYFATYEGLLRVLCQSQMKPRKQAGLKQFILSGGAAGWMYWTLVYPFDVIKTQKQNGKPYKEILRKIRKNAFKGYGLMATRSIIVNCCSFPAFEQTKALFAYLRRTEH